MKSSGKKRPDPGPKAAPRQAAGMPLGPVNYLFIAIGTLVIGVSYAGMYLEKAVDGFFSMYIAPVALTGAYLWVLFAIFYRPKPATADKKSGTA